MHERLLIALIGGATLLSAAQNSGGSLADQLRAQYKLVRMGSDSTGLVVLEPGTVLVVKAGGILSVPPLNVAIAQHTFKGSQLHGPNSFVRGLLGENTRYLSVGEKVYITKVEVKSGKKVDKIAFNIAECDSCNGFDQASSYKAQVGFEFPADYLTTAKIADVEGVISQVLAMESGPAANPEAAANPEPAAAEPAPAAPEPATEAPPPPIAPPPPPPEEREPATISLGQTPDQVVAALGQPQKKAVVGNKQIFYYKDMKITFVGGKVSNVE